jgi:threonine dehydratase
MLNITDLEMSRAMIFAYNHLKLFLEPACVAGFAALKKFKQKKLKDQNTLILLCGSNIDFQSWNSIINN